METAVQHGLLLGLADAPFSVVVVGHVSVQTGLFTAVLQHLIAAVPGDADQGITSRQDREAHIRQALRKVRVEAILLRHDAPALALPQVGVYLHTAAYVDLMLLKALAYAVTGLSADPVHKLRQLQRGQAAAHLALRNTPEPAIPHLRGEVVRLYLLVYAVRPVEIGHHAALDLLRAFRVLFHPAALLLECCDDLRGVLRRFTGVHGDVILQAVFLIVIGCRHGHVQLQRLEGRGQDGEAVRSQHQVQAAATVPIYQEVACVIDALQRPHAPRLHRVRIIFHLSELDPAALWELLPQKIQPFFRYLVHLHHSSHRHIYPAIVFNLTGILLSVQVADHIVHSLSDRWIIGQRLTAEAGGGLEGQLLTDSLEIFLRVGIVPPLSTGEGDPPDGWLLVQYLLEPDGGICHHRVILEAVQLQSVLGQPLTAIPVDGQIHSGDAVLGDAQPLVLAVEAGI